MKIRFIGVGSAFTTARYYQSNMLVGMDDGPYLLLDCGNDVRFALNECGIRHADLHRAIDAVYISHLHSDHVGGLEWLAFTTYFGPGPRPKLYAQQRMLERLWEHSLQGGLGSIEGKMMHLTDYFDCYALPADGRFEWHGLRCSLVEMPHVLNGYDNHYSYGLVLHPRHSLHASAFISTDTRFVPDILERIAPKVELIFHECETAPHRSKIHTHYEELCSLPAHIKQKMWLYHYQPDPPYVPSADGFRGFVEKGQVFEPVSRGAV